MTRDSYLLANPSARANPIGAGSIGSGDTEHYGDTVHKVLLAGRNQLLIEGLSALLESQTQFTVVGLFHDAESVPAQLRSSEPEIAILTGELPAKKCREPGDYLFAADSTAFVYLAPCDTKDVFGTKYDGFSALLSQECEFGELLTALQVILAGGIYISPIIRSNSSLIAAQKLPVPLSGRELQVLMHLAHGESSKQIARNLELSPKTVSTYRSRIMSKLDLHSAAELTSYAFRLGLVN
ncbi:response regulator transcription factor [Pseudohalioglobus sediminis]|uniref:Response regulator transcription factor n=1 Tax=Pseudohalioglobus sediminis TaxID=2606449 RepID=A0A5B0X4N2_9GAMM|nr:response regulator transcription factor [Pseudohalioglobus sediminis]KAA1193251.1 response regulator transcription factor [Pseudohalioglobus sediminis]